MAIQCGISKLLTTAVFAVVCASSAVQAYSESDSYNSFQWNRHNPMAGLGAVDKGDWFEWWYYKAVVPGTNQAYYFIYGAVNPWDTAGEKKASRSYVGFGNFDERRIYEQRFPVTALQASYDTALVTIGANRATERRITGQMRDAASGREVSWDVLVTPEWNFNAMGWSTGLQGISNIYWYPAQASARMNGVILEGDQTIWLNNVPAYQDRNWGRSFPDWWTWIVSNHFESAPGSALAVGGGMPRFLERYSVHEGLCIGLMHKGQEYVFRTTDGDGIRMDVRWGTWEVTGVNRRGQKIEVSAYAPKEKFMDLKFETPSGQVFHDFEALTGDLRVRLFEKDTHEQSGWRLVDELTSHAAGIEYGSFNSYDIDAAFTGEVTLQNTLR